MDGGVLLLEGLREATLPEVWRTGWAFMEGGGYGVWRYLCA